MMIAELSWLALKNVYLEWHQFYGSRLSSMPYPLKRRQDRIGTRNSNTWGRLDLNKGVYLVRANIVEAMET